MLTHFINSITHFMDNKKLSIFILVATILVVDTSAIQEFEVGGGKGWNNGVDFEAWAQRDFIVGDILVFNYEVGKHNVLEVDEKSYHSCFVCPTAKPHSSGKDEIKLETPGYKYFIDGIENGKNCKENNVKLWVMVPPPLKTSVKSSAAPATPKVYVVGDEKGWNVGVDYQAWAEGKEFDLGDKLVFKYPLGKHNVIFADEASLNECKVPPSSEVFSTGNDEITLGRIGKHGFICGVGDHCQKGQKLSIQVICPYAKPKKDPTVQGARKLVQEN